MPKNNKDAKEVERLKESYNIQKTTMDKIWFFMLTSAKIGIIQADYFTDSEREQYETLINEDKKAADIMKNAVLGGYKLPKGLHKSAELDKFEDDLTKHIYSTFVDDESARAIYKGLDDLAILELKVNIQVGRELLEVLKSFKEDDPLRMQKAIYVLGRSQSYGTQLEYGISNFKSSVCMTYPEWTKEQSDYLQYKTHSLSKFLSKEDLRLYKLGIAARDGSHPTSSPEMMKWVNEEGIRMGEELRKKNVALVYKRVSEELDTSKQYKLADDKAFSEVFASMKVNVNDVILRGLIADLESTGTGNTRWYNFAWHSSNSPEYDKMLNTLKMYSYSVEAGEMVKAIDLKEKLINATVTYLKDKTSSVRDSDFGKKRFDDAMLLLSELMPVKRFERFVEMVNRHRGAKPGKTDYIDIVDYSRSNRAKADNLYSKLHHLGREIDDKKQEASRTNRIKLPDVYVKRIDEIEKVYGIDSMKLPKGKDDLVPIGPYFKFDKIDNKDFSTLAYLSNVGNPAFTNGDKSPKAHDERMKLIKSATLNVADALRAYQVGNKAPLAEIIRNDVNNILNECDNAKYVDDSYIINAEMGRRIKGMIDRDPELFTIASKKGMNIEELGRLSAITHSATTFTRGYESFKKVVDAEKGGPKVSKDMKLEAVTDIIMKRVIDESIILKREGKSKSTLLPDIEKKSGYTELRNEVKAFVVKDGINKLSTVELKKYMQDISFGFKVKRFVTDRIEKSLEAKPVKKSSVKKQGVNKNKALGIN